MVKFTIKELLGMAAIYCGIYTFLPVCNLETIWARLLFFVGVSCIAFGTVGTVEIFMEMIQDWKHGTRL